MLYSRLKLKVPKSRLKICVLGTRGFPNIQGGIEKHCEHLYTHLAEKGCHVIVLARKPYVGEDIIFYNGVKIVPLPCPKSKFLEAFLHTLCGIYEVKKIGCDILHVHGIGPSLLIPLARLLGLKVIMTNHGPDYQRKKWGRLAKLVLRLGEYLGSWWANAIICISQSIADNIKRKFHKEATVIPNGVIMPEILQSTKTLRKYNLNKKKCILSVGRFVPEKGFHDLIDAFNQLQTLNSVFQTGIWKLVIVGEADHPDKYSLELKQKAKISKNIMLTGFMTGKPLKELYSHAGLFVLPSYYEGLPIVLLEAMSYGLSCIASDIPGNRNVLLPEDRYFKVGDIEGLSEKIKEFVDKQLTAEEKRKQLDLISQRYNWKRIADMTLGVYQRVAHF